MMSSDSFIFKQTFYFKYGKRVFDMVWVTIGLVVLSPLFCVLAVLVKYSSPGSIFFVQERVGRDFKPFNMVKFRTMVMNTEVNHSLVTAANDARITPIGAWLRRYKLDELPQLFNVLKGDMSLVGPRPEVDRYIQQFKADYDVILKVRPGITDNAAIQFKNEETILQQYDDVQQGYIDDILPKKIKLYKAYIKNMTFCNDLYLIIKTIV